MVDRIKLIMDNKQLSPAQLAERLDINRSNLTHLFSGRNQPSLDLAKKILEAFPEINTEWLIMGVGPMQKTDFEESVPAEEVSNTSVELDLFSALPEVEKQQSDEPEIPRRKKNVSTTTPRESNNSTSDLHQVEKINSQRVKNVEKIVFFYSDKTFEVYHLS